MSANPRAEPSVLLRQEREGICTLTLNRPQQMNLLTTEMLSALQDSFDDISENEKIRVVILAASGKGFCAGHDLKEIRALHPTVDTLIPTARDELDGLRALKSDLNHAATPGASSAPVRDD